MVYHRMAILILDYGTEGTRFHARALLPDYGIVLTRLHALSAFYALRLIDHGVVTP